MRILHTADWHIGNFPGPEKDGENLRAQDTIKCIEHLIAMAKREQPDLALIYGDIFHQDRVWSDRGITETKIAIQLLELLSQFCEVVVMRGTPNHDGKEHFDMLKTHFGLSSHVAIITEPTVLKFPLLGNGTAVACLPGFDRGTFRAKFPGRSKEEENQAFTEELGKIILGLRAQCKDDAAKVLVSHYTVPGCNVESGQVQFLSQFEPVLLPEVLDSAGFDLVALGHIHRPQQILSCKNTFYSGAVNAMNFNDEGQERGFWIHDMDTDDHSFVETPYRKFSTFHFTDTDVVGINTGDIDAVADNWWNRKNGSDIKDKIVRILYTCSDEANKAFNKALLEQRLYADGAFWVSEISPENIVITANRDNLSEKADPEANLMAYLTEKAFTDDATGKIIEIARPIIATATANNIVSRLTGAFIPLEIEVKNYRNYAEERFDFREISFCTINGMNGSGKSSLFMDAILDCLYEEPREKDLTGWIRASEDSKSGSIKFTFSIGEKTFRITRTRMKSGKATLNISELVDDEWLDRSKEKIRDTQDEIINILGMDSLTFRSCALIMQDQYGLFLQADKESRMTILGTLLGLGIYADMEEITRDKLTDANRSVRDAVAAVERMTEQVSLIGDVSERIKAASESLVLLEGEKAAATSERDDIALKFLAKEEAQKRAEKISRDIDDINEKKSLAEGKMAAQEMIRKEAEEVLAAQGEITEGVKSYEGLLEKEKGLIAVKSNYDSKKSDLKRVDDDVSQLENRIAVNEQKSSMHQSAIDTLRAKLSREPDLKASYDLYMAKKNSLATMEEKYDGYVALISKRDNLKTALAEQIAEYNSEVSTRTARIKEMQQKTALLSNANCVDIESAKCSFLADAKVAHTELVPYIKECTEWKESKLSEQKKLKDDIDSVEIEVSEIGYDPDRAAALRKELSDLEPDKTEYESLSIVRDKISQIQDQITEISIQMADDKKRLAEAKNRAQVLAGEVALAEDGARTYDDLQNQIELAKIWLEKEKQLPVAREKKQTAALRKSELAGEISSIEAELLEKEEQLRNEKQIASGAEFLQIKLSEAQQTISGIESKAGEINMEIGRLSEKAVEVERLSGNISEAIKQQTAFAERAAMLDTLKKAFSQDGIPHNIIRSVLPTLAGTSNNILGQMTGGKMGLEFVTEKAVKSNSNKEIVTLDILIQEHGKDTLPYLSKSGGEKVKASLSVILALADIKSSQAGIQLGMLFIDEPPFLDQDGIQAYCDALETIQSRYSNVKVMAITHDPTMKARFPQSVDVIKTDAGSKVVCI